MREAFIKTVIDHCGVTRDTAINDMADPGIQVFFDALIDGATVVAERYAQLLTRLTVAGHSGTSRLHSVSGRLTTDEPLVTEAERQLHLIIHSPPYQQRRRQTEGD